MKSIWKYTLKMLATEAVMMPEGARIILCAAQDAALCVWAEVETTAPLVPRLIEIIGTGEERGDWSSLYIGTAQLTHYVWHVFERVTLNSQPSTLN